MEFLFQNLNQGLNKGYLKQGVTRTEINVFKANLVRMFGRIDESESEEHLKNIVADFLKDTYYKNRFEINTKDRKDLVIHHGKSAKDAVGLILEAKKPTNKTEMISVENPNKKALHELILYYLEEVHEKNNHEIKYLVVTNIWEWFIFDGVWFEKNVFRNAELKKKYTDWKVSGNNTQHFYDHIAKVFLDLGHFDKLNDPNPKFSEPLPCTHFNLKYFQKLAEAPVCEEDNDLISLYKTFSPEHLLRKPFANDSNTLNKEFYFELLYILGLEEVKDGTKKVIQRAKIQHIGSLLENTLQELKSRKRLAVVPNVLQYGENEDEQLFSIALELCITWLNRILFLKLLESQMIKYRKDNTFFLHFDYIKDFDELNELFFDVLAVPISERTGIAKAKFGHLPYLNSSLFDETELETYALAITGLKNRLEMPIFAQTVLKDGKGNIIKGKKNTLQYLFEFLSSYDFAGESGVKIQQESKSIINAAVLGLIFEKINGYKDGAFFTPGYITMYMCRETIRKAVVQKFNDKYNWKCEDFEKLKENIDFRDKKARQEANELINSLKICDPSVGSGHFLVSALNEIISIKSELNVLCHLDGTRIRAYQLKIDNDEILINDAETDQSFQYRLNQNHNAIVELQEVQEAIFNEKKIIIENCLFGVDINAKSVSICRLRLWIELLKNMYYTKESKYVELETLPNLDINIKVGNSLVSRFSTNNTNQKNVLPKERVYIKQLIDKYKVLVFAYKNVRDYHSKQDIRRQIALLKSEFEKFSIPNDTDFLALRKKESEIQQISFAFDADDRNNQIKLAEEIKVLRQKYMQKLQTLYLKSLEWRFEFPEVLDENGDFIGFDVVVANPPYGIAFSANMQQLLSNSYQAFAGRGESYILFIEKAINLLSNKGFLGFIIPDTLLNLDFTNLARQYILKYTNLLEIDALPSTVFADATVDTILLFLQKNNENEVFKHTDVSVKTYAKKENITSLAFPHHASQVSTKIWLQDGTFNLKTNPFEYTILHKVEEKFPRLADFAEMFSGIKVYEVGKGNPPQSAQVRDNKPFTSDYAKDIKWKPFLDGKHIGRYEMLWENNNWLLYGDWLAAPRSQYHFEGEKILIRKIVGQQLIAHYVTDTFYCNTLLFILKLKENIANITYKSLLGIINSTFIAWYFGKKCQITAEDTFPQIMIKDVLQFPIPNINNEIMADIETCVKNLLRIKQEKQTHNTSLLEKEIDQLVYQLYGLSEAEIAIIEGEK